MTNYLEDSPVLGRSYCPGCEPNADPIEEILDTRWCDRHAPVRDGSEDEGVLASAYLSGSAEAGGEDNRLWCDFIHRGKLNGRV